MRAFILVLLVALLPLALHAAVIVADNPVDYLIGGQGPPQACSLRGAVLNANADSIVDTNCPAGDGPDTIILATDFTFLEGGRGEDGSVFGDLDVSDILAIQPDTGIRTINAANIDRIFDVFGDHLVGLTLTNLTLANGLDNGFPDDEHLGAAIRTTGDPYVILDNVIIDGCVVDLSSQFEALNATAGVMTFGVFQANDVIFRNNRVIDNIPGGSTITGAVSIYSKVDTFIDNFLLDNNEIEDITTNPNTVATAGFGLFGIAKLICSGYAQNNQGKDGGVAYVSENSEELVIQLTGDLTGNVGNAGGCFHHRSFLPLLIDFNGFSAIGNSARRGGVIYGESSHAVVEFYDDISNNQADVQGGFGYGSNFDFIVHNGNTIQNNNATFGGFLWVSGGYVSMINVTSITGNTAQNEGAVVYVNNAGELTPSEGITIQNVKLIDSNVGVLFDSIGGVVSAHSANVELLNIETITNQFAYQGGVISQITNTTGIYEVTLSDCSLIAHNRVDHPDEAGGIIYSLGADAHISNINGEIYNNTAHNGDGAIMAVRNANAYFTDSVVQIYDNFAFSGTVMFVKGPGSIGKMENMVADIYDNTGFFNGGIMSCDDPTGHCEINQFTGGIRDTECGSGCVIHSEGSATITNFVGDMSNNNAHFEGGLVLSRAKMIINGIDGLLSNNKAEQVSGGCFYTNSTETMEITGIAKIDGNFAKMDGAVAYSENGAVVMDRCCLISNNICEDGNGGVIFASGDASISFSELVGNLPDTLVSQFGTVTIDTNFDPLSGTATLTAFNGQYYVADAAGFSGSGGYGFLWDNGDTTATTNNIQAATTNVVINDDSFCRVTQTIVIPNPVADAGLDLDVCPGDPFTIGGFPAGFAGTVAVPGRVSYEWSPAGNIVGDASNVFIANPQATINDVTGTFTLVVTDTATGQTDTDSMVANAIPITVDAGPDPLICQGSSAVIGGSPTAVSNAVNLQYSWEPTIGLNDPSLANPIASPTATTTYTVTVTSSFCNSLRFTDSVTVNVIATTVVNAVASPEEGVDSFFICNGDSITLGGESTGSGQLFYSWSPSTGLSNPSNANPIASPSVTTTYTLTVSSAGQCDTDTDTVTVVVNDLVTDAGFDLIDSGILGGIPTAVGGASPYFYNWEPSIGLSNVALANPFAQPLVSTSYHVTATDANGCSITSSDVNVIVRNTATTGYTSIKVSYITDNFNSLTAVAASLNEIISDVLDIPSLAVGIETVQDVFVDGNPNGQYLSNIDIYQFGKNGAELVDDLMVLFGCTPGVLPCVVNPGSSLMLQVGWDYLEFVAPNNSGNPSNSLSYNSLSTLSSFSYTVDYGDDDVDFTTSLIRTILLDDDDNIDFSDLINGIDDDEETTYDIEIGTLSIATTFISSVYVQVATVNGAPTLVASTLVMLAGLVIVI